MQYHRMYYNVADIHNDHGITIFPINYRDISHSSIASLPYLGQITHLLHHQNYNVPTPPSYKLVYKLQ